MKGYVGRRELDGPKVYVVQVDELKATGGMIREPLKHLVLHSPDGFEWGYLGSGPADLALAILGDWFGEEPTKAELDQGHFDITLEELKESDRTNTPGELLERKRLLCVHYHQPFKEAFVAKFAKESWKLEGHTIGVWIRKQKHDRLLCED